MSYQLSYVYFTYRHSCIKSSVYWLLYLGTSHILPKSYYNMCNLQVIHGTMGTGDNARQICAVIANYLISGFLNRPRVFICRND